jgi:alpha-L-rhamnosidase
MVKIKRVCFEHREENTIGIRESAPRISWSFKRDENNWKQVSYELEITCWSGEFETWAVESEQSSLVPWIEAPLDWGEKAAVRVRVFGNDGGRSVGVIKVPLKRARLTVRIGNVS